MLVTMRADHEDSVNDGRTRQRFEAGKTYDVPDPVGQAWGAAGLANSTEDSGLRTEAQSSALSPQSSRRRKEK
jgi:hypothetical protein